MPTDPRIVTEADIRLFLIDKTEDDNYLLDNVEFTPEEIAQAHGHAVDKYNSTLPLVHIATELPRYEAIIGTAAILLRMKAINHARNQLEYSNKSGTAVQDKNKAQIYLSIAQGLMGEFDQRIQALKIHINLELCYGYVGSQYARGRF